MGREKLSIEISLTVRNTINLRLTISCRYSMRAWDNRCRGEIIKKLQCPLPKHGVKLV